MEEAGTEEEVLVMDIVDIKEIIEKLKKFKLFSQYPQDKLDFICKDRELFSRWFSQSFIRIVKNHNSSEMYELFKFFLDNGADVNAMYCEDTYYDCGYNALMYSLERNDKELLLLIIQYNPRFEGYYEINEEITVYFLYKNAQKDLQKIIENHFKLEEIKEPYIYPQI